ncbi:uncharacterized protein [Lolium perenne]|uniref:uncharacterized protein n=1 Tax=Lolium perenne TaxID=4522 RepID=UPI0021E9EB6E|nr:uncharacterized protein LOC127302518 isoform X3 [Lolium perenne]
MEAVAEAAAMVDLNTLSRRELQALCKLNGVRANMTNLAMVDALHSLPSVDGIDQIGTTLCLPTPGKSAVKSVLRTAASSDQQQQQGSPLPRGRRVSVKSPEAIRMDAEGEEDETKRDLFREIVRTPGVALRSTSRRPRATPAPLPTPAAGTLRRSQRSTVRKATAPVEEVVVSTAKRSTRKTAIRKVAIDFDQEEEDAAGTKGVTSDEKCEDPEEEEVTKLPEEETSKGDEPEQEGEGAAAIEEEEKLVNPEKSAPLSAMEDSPILGVLSKVAPEPDMNNVANSSTEAREGLSNWSPVRGIADGINNASEDKEDAAVEVLGEAVEEHAFNSTIEAAASPATAAMTEKEIAVAEINNASEGKEDAAVEVLGEAIEEDAFNSTVEAAAAPNKIVTAAMSEKEIAVDESPEEYILVGQSSEEADLTKQSSEVDDLHQDEADLTEQNSEVDDLDQDEADLTEQSSVVDDLDQDEEDMLKAGRTIDEESDGTIEVAAAPNKMDPAAATEMEVAVDEVPQADLTDDESADEYDQDGESSEGADLSEESSEVDDLDEEEEEDMLKADQTVDEESDDTIEVSGSIDVNFDSDEEEEQLKMSGTGEETDEVEESDSLSGDEDDFSGDLSSEFDDVLNFIDGETERDSSPVALKGIDAAAATPSAAKTVESVITEETEVSSEGDVVSQHVDTTVESLDKVVITEKKEECAKEKTQLKVGKEMSLRKLKSAYKESLIAAKEGKKLTIATNDGNRVALAELDDNADC